MTGSFFDKLVIGIAIAMALMALPTATSSLVDLQQPTGFGA